jgi:predicted ArsR family transcriptional regulator
MIDWWNETDTEILECLRRHGAMSPDELGRHLGISEGEASAFLAMLVREGKVSIRLVDLSAASQEAARRSDTGWNAAR